MKQKQHEVILRQFWLYEYNRNSNSEHYWWYNWNLTVHRRPYVAIPMLLLSLRAKCLPFSNHLSNQKALKLHKFHPLISLPQPTMLRVYLNTEISGTVENWTINLLMKRTRKHTKASSIRKRTNLKLLGAQQWSQCHHLEMEPLRLSFSWSVIVPLNAFQFK